MAPHDIFLCGVTFNPEIQAGAIGALDFAPIAAKLGIAGVEYRPDYWTDLAREVPAVVEQLSEFGLKSTYATMAWLFGGDAAALRGHVDTARRLGSPLMRVFRGRDPEGSDIADARNAATYAADQGITLVMENYVRAPGNLLDQVHAALEAIDSPTVRTNVDTGNYVKNDQDPVGAVKRLGPWIGYCHFKDIRIGDDGLPVATYPGNGKLDLDRVLAALDELPQEIPFGFEYPGEGAPETAIAKGKEFVEARSGRRA